MRAVFIQHHLELLNLLKTTLSHYWRQLSQIRHVIGVHRENLGLGGWLHEVVSLLLGVCIRLKISDILEHTPVVVVYDDIVYRGNLLL